MGTAKCIKRRHHVSRNLERFGGTTRTLHGRPRMIGRQFESGRGTGETTTPEVELARESQLSLAFKRLRPPAGIVAVLQRRVRRHAVVGVNEVLHQHTNGPAVRDDVVHGGNKQMIVGRQVIQRGTEERPPRQIKRRADVLLSQLHG